MTSIAVAIGWCLLAQAPGSSAVEPIRPARTAPPAELGDAELGEVQSPADEPLATEDPWSDEIAPVEAAVPPDRYRMQEPQIAPADEESAGNDGASDNLEALGATPRLRLRPPELIADALENPQRDALPGTPLTLAQALARAANRQQQLHITQNYWRLATAQAEYHWALAQRGLVRDRTRSHVTAAAALAAHAAAEAEVRDRQVAVDQAQQALADLLGFTELPLATDRPHVGGYRTVYEGIFAGRPAPARIRLIHRTLPVRRKAIDARAEAVVAATDAVEAAGQQNDNLGQGLNTLLDAIELLGRQRRAFIAEVRDYNLEIAEYACAVAPPGAPGDTLISMLIRSTPPSNDRTRSTESDADPAIRRTIHSQPNGSGASVTDPDRWTSDYPDGLDPQTVDDPALYQGLLEIDNHPLRVQKLGNLLHWDRNLPAEFGEPKSLAECLANVPSQERLAVILAFWQARQYAGLYQLVVEQQQQLAELQAIAVGLRGEPGMAEAGVRLHAARCAARAAEFQAQLRLLASQFELMQAMGQPLDGDWSMPSTPPQSGRYLVSGRKGGNSSGDAARWADVTSVEYQKVCHRADAVIQSDALRADLVLQAHQGSARGRVDDGHLTPLDRAIWATRRQHERTCEFLDDLTDYNLAIAHYALAMFPAAMSGDALAGKLAIARSTRRDS